MAHRLIRLLFILASVLVSDSGYAGFTFTQGVGSSDPDRPGNPSIAIELGTL